MLWMFDRFERRLLGVIVVLLLFYAYGSTQVQPPTGNQVMMGLVGSCIAFFTGMLIGRAMR